MSATFEEEMKSFTIFLASVLACLLSSCKTTTSLELPQGPNPFAGNWISYEIDDPKNYGPSVGWELHFQPDGSFNQLSDSGFGIQSKKEGSYTFNDDILFLGYNGRHEPWQPSYYFLGGDLTIKSPGSLGWSIKLKRTDKPHEELRGLPTRPESLKEAVETLKILLSKEELEQISSKTEVELWEYHFGLGLFIRNGFGLWGGNRELLRDCGSARMHPDDASGVIISALWENLQKDDSNRAVDTTAVSAPR